MAPDSGMSGFHVFDPSCPAGGVTSWKSGHGDRRAVRTSHIFLSWDQRDLAGLEGVSLILEAWAWKKEINPQESWPDVSASGLSLSFPLQ
jgi:hypothetical protein